MHYASHVLMRCIALWCLISDGGAARNAVSPEILANFAKNVASVISPVILSGTQTRNNRSSFRSVLTIPTGGLEIGNSGSPSTLDNVVDRTTGATAYYGSNPRTGPYPYNGLYNEDSTDGLKGSGASEELEGSARDESYLRQERPSPYERPYRPYRLSPDSDGFEATQKPAGAVESSIRGIEQSPSNRYSSYQGAGLYKAAALGHEPYLGAKPYGGFHGFGPGFGFGYGRPYHGNGGGDEPEDSDEEVEGESARLGNNGTVRRDYGPPHFGGHGYHYGYSPFPYGGYPNFGPYGPFHGRDNDSSVNGQNRHYGYGPYGDGFDGFYGPHHGYGYNGNGNGNGDGNGNGNGDNRQVEEPAENGDENNGTKNGYPYPYGPPLVKPFLGTFHPHGFPSPFNLLPYDHFHFKGGHAGVGHAGYPIYADPFLIGFPFHHPYGPYYHGKRNRYVPPKDKPSDSSEESEEAPEATEELTENENPERVTALSGDVVAPASTSNRYKASRQKGPKRVGLLSFENRKI